jgi:hypothetical protein
MVQTVEPKAVDRHLATTAQDGDTGRQQLVFDPHTGQLVVTDRRSADAVIVDSINEDGFFAPGI